MKQFRDQPIHGIIQKNNYTIVYAMKRILIFSLMGILFFSLCNCYDQSHYVKIALEVPNSADQYYNSEKFNKGIKAIHKITDQNLWIKIVMEAENTGIQYEAAKKITDPAILAKILLEKNSKGSRANILRIIFSPFYANNKNNTIEPEKDSMQLKNFIIEDNHIKIVSDSKDSGIIFLNKLLLAFDDVPMEYQADRINEILSVIHLLRLPKVSHYVGDIVSIKIKYEVRSAQYTGDISGVMGGEWLQYAIKLSKINVPLIQGWGSPFPLQTNTLSFLPAIVIESDLISPILDKIGQDGLIEIAFRDADMGIGSVIVDKIDDQAALERIALDADNLICAIAAVNKINNQSILEKIVSETEDPDHKLAAISRLTNQTLLKEIVANKHEEMDIRIAAIEQMTDQTELERLASKEKIKDLRIAAIHELTDQSLLENIVMDNDSAFEKMILKRMEEKKNNAIAQQIFNEELEKHSIEKNEFRLAAVQNLANQTIMEKIVMNNNERNEFRYAVLEKITDKAILEKIINNVKDPELHQNAINFLDEKSNTQ